MEAVQDDPAPVLGDVFPLVEFDDGTRWRRVKPGRAVRWQVPTLGRRA